MSRARTRQRRLQAAFGERWRAPVPGLPSMVTAETPRENFGVLWMFPTPFVEGGSAWVELSHAGKAEGLGPQWVEVLGSEVLAARERRETQGLPEKESKDDRSR